MYQVFCSGIPIHDLRDEALVLIEPQLSLEVNTAGVFTFKIAPTHPRYSQVERLRPEILVLQDGVELFRGRVIEQGLDFYNLKTVCCEGELSFLNDSIQRPAEYHNMTVRGYLEALTAIHNQQVEEGKQFEVGMVTVKDNNESLYRYTNWENTLTTIKDDLVGSLGGFVRVRNEDGHRYLDYLEDYTNTNLQPIAFGENLMDFTRNLDASEIATAIIPLGARLEESSIPALEEYLTIRDVNGGVDYLYSREAVQSFGWVFRTVTWDNVHTPSILKGKGEQYLKDIQFDKMAIEARAVDLHYTDAQMEQFKLGDRIRVISPPHGLDRFFPLSKMEINLLQPSNNTITLGAQGRASLTAAANNADEAILKKLEGAPKKSEILEEAIRQATSLINAKTTGHVVTTGNEQLIMDTDDQKTATKVWRWNINGLGYSKNGYAGPFETAITMDGQIVGDRLVGGSVSAEKIDITYRGQVEKQIQDAEQSANDATEEKLKSYWTASQTETSIRNTAESILLTAKEDAEGYLDGKLKEYSTSAQIKVTTDSIITEVSKKFDTESWMTTLEQSATGVQIAWNNIDKKIQFEEGELRIYNTSEEEAKLSSKFNYMGNHFYRDNYYVGKIGTDDFSEDASQKGLDFDLGYNAAYMTWAFAKNQSDEDAETYGMIWTYVRPNRALGNLDGANTYGTLHANCPVNLHNHELKHADLKNSFPFTEGITEEIKVPTGTGITKWILSFYKGVLVGLSKT